MRSQDEAAEPTFPKAVVGSEYGPRTVWENWALLCALQASQGSIGPEVNGIAVEALLDRVVLHVCLARRTPDALDDVPEMEGDLSLDLDQVFPDSDVSVESRIQVGDTDPSWSGYRHRRLYLVARDGRHG